MAELDPESTHSSAMHQSAGPVYAELPTAEEFGMENLERYWRSLIGKNRSQLLKAWRDIEFGLAASRDGQAQEAYFAAARERLITVASDTNRSQYELPARKVLAFMPGLRRGARKGPPINHGEGMSTTALAGDSFVSLG